MKVQQKRQRSPVLLEDTPPTKMSRLGEAHADLADLLIQQQGDVSWSLTNGCDRHEGKDFQSLARQIRGSSSIWALHLEWYDGQGGLTSLEVLEKLKCFSELRSLSLLLETEDDPDVATALAASLRYMHDLERLDLGGFISDEAFAPLTTALPAGLRNLRLHDCAPEAQACLLEQLFITPLPHLECLHLQCNEKLHDEDALHIWARLGAALVKWMPLAPSLCKLRYPAEVRWVVAAYPLLCTLAKSPSLHDLRFSPDHKDREFEDVDNNLRLIRPQLTENFDKLLRFPYGFFDAICSAVMATLSTTGTKAPSEIAQLVQAFWMGRNTPGDRRRALALVCVCKAFRDLAKKASGKAIAAQLLNISVDRQATILQQYGLATEATVQRLQDGLNKM